MQQIQNQTPVFAGIIGETGVDVSYSKPSSVTLMLTKMPGHCSDSVEARNFPFGMNMSLGWSFESTNNGTTTRIRKPSGISQYHKFFSGLI